MANTFPDDFRAHFLRVRTLGAEASYRRHSLLSSFAELARRSLFGQYFETVWV